MDNQQKLFQYIEALESIRHMFRPHKYKFILAEALVHYYSHKTDSLSEIRDRVNTILKRKNIDEISLGFVRNIVQR